MRNRYERPNKGGKQITILRFREEDAKQSEHTTWIKSHANELKCCDFNNFPFPLPPSLSLIHRNNTIVWQATANRSIYQNQSMHVRIMWITIEVQTHRWSMCRWFFVAYIGRRRYLEVWCADLSHVVLRPVASTKSRQHKLINSICTLCVVCECTWTTHSTVWVLANETPALDDERVRTNSRTSAYMQMQICRMKIGIHLPQMLRWEPTQLQWREVLSVCLSNSAGSDLPTPTVMNMQSHLGETQPRYMLKC